MAVRRIWRPLAQCPSSNNRAKAVHRIDQLPNTAYAAQLNIFASSHNTHTQQLSHHESQPPHVALKIPSEMLAERKNMGHALLWHCCGDIHLGRLFLQYAQSNLSRRVMSATTPSCGTIVALDSSDP